MALVTVIACGAGTIRASAIVVNAGLSYNLTIEKVSSKQVTLHIDAKNNPGILVMSFIVYYDDNCTLLPNKTAYTGCSFVQTANTSKKCVVYSTVQTAAVTSNVSITCYFSTSDSADKSHEFSTGVLDCKMEDGVIVQETDGMDVSIETNTAYTLCDVDNDSKITIDDSSAILDIASRNGTSAVSVTYANRILSTLRKTYPNLVCAEAADANRNGTINQTDAHGNQ